MSEERRDARVSRSAPQDASFERILRLARRTFDVSIAVIRFVGETTQWVKAATGVDLTDDERPITPLLEVTAQDGLQRYRENAYNAALIDYGLAHTNGVALAHQMREVDEEMERRSAPVLLLSMLGENARSRVSMDAPNLASRMAKPIRPGQLRRRLVRLLEHGLEHADELKEPQSEFESDLADQHPLRIILAEDNVVNPKVMRRLLRELGYRTDVVANGLEAVQAVRRQTYDLVLMDV